MSTIVSASFDLIGRFFYEGIEFFNILFEANVRDSRSPTREARSVSSAPA
jgi:hypothetical protein